MTKLSPRRTYSPLLSEIPVGPDWIRLVSDNEVMWIKVSAIDFVSVWETEDRLEDGETRKVLTGEIIIGDRFVAIPDPVLENAKRILSRIMRD